MQSHVKAATLVLMTISAGAFSQEAVAPSLHETIRSSFPESYDEIANTFDPLDIPELLEMLNSENDEEYWPRVAGVLGVVGDEDTVDVLIGLVEKPIIGPVYISQAQHDTRREAMRALGFLAGRTDNERALDYLIESLDDGIWRQRNIRGVVPYLDTYDLYDRQLTIYAIFGLALSGHPRAGEALLSLQQSPTPSQALLQLDDTLDTWIQVYDVAAERGVAGMYEHYEAERQIEAERSSE